MPALRVISRQPSHADFPSRNTSLALCSSPGTFPQIFPESHVRDLMREDQLPHLAVDTILTANKTLPPSFVSLRPSESTSE